jgi:hypothetical protein
LEGRASSNCHQVIDDPEKLLTDELGAAQQADEPTQIDVV